MRFSIVIPAYNYGAILGRAVESALAQSGDDYEVLVIDDGSTDQTPQVLAELQRKHPRLKFLRQENRGLAAVRNRGVDETTGDYLLFLDADDRLLPTALERFRAFLEQHPGPWGMVFAGHLSVHPDGRVKEHPARPLGADRGENFRGYLRRRFGISNGAALMSRGVFSSIRYPEHLRSTEDIPVFAQVLALYDCTSISEPVLEVHKHDDSMRNDLEAIRRTGTSVVDRLFDPQILPQELMACREEFLARQSLSLFRALYLARRYREARGHFHEGIRRSPRLLLEGAYLSKYLRSFLKGELPGGGER